LAAKQKARALLDYMRSKGKIPECGTSKQREPDSRLPQKHESTETPESASHAATPKIKSNDVESAPAYNNVRLSQQEEN